MSFINNKIQTVNNVALLEVLGNLPKGRVTSSLESVNSKNKNLIPFLLDLLSVTCKDNVKNPKDKLACQTTSILLRILTELYPNLIRIVKEGIIEGIKSGLACGVDFTIPNPAPQVILKVKNIDFTDLLKIDPLSSVGSMFYGKNVNVDFNWFLYDLIQTNGSSTWKNILDVTYLSSTEEFDIRINSSYVGKKFNTFLIDFINSIDLISLENLITKLMNGLTGSLYSNIEGVNYSLDKIIDIEKINSLQDKISIADPSKEEYEIDDSFFSFSNEELNEIERKSNQMYDGVTSLDLGCGIFEVTVDTEVLKTSFDEIRSTPQNRITNVVQNNFNTISDNLVSNIADEDKETSKLSINAKLIELLPKILTNIILEPKIVVLYQISLKTVNNIVINVTNGFDYVKACKVFFEYVIRESVAAFIEILFKVIKEEVIKLVSQVALRITKEQNDLRIRAITSIVTGISDGVLSTINVPTNNN
jgi:hypothetical protein